MTRFNKRLGIGAVVEVLASRVHPSKLIRDKYGENGLDKAKIENLIVIRKELKSINRRNNVVSVVCRHDDFPNEELYCAINTVKLKKSGDKAHYFINETTTTPEEEEVNNNNINNREELVEELRPTNVPVNSQIDIDDIRRIEAEGFTVDDDNLPAEDNIPTANDNNQQVQWSANWGFHGIDLRHEHSQQLNHRPKMPRSDFKEEFNLFWQFFPKDYIVNVVLPATNKNLTKELKIGEFSRWLGLVFLMSTIEGCERRDFWSEEEIDAFEGAPLRFGGFMSCTRFEEIMSALRLTDMD